jgi:hypothetical protein
LSLGFQKVQLFERTVEGSIEVALVFVHIFGAALELMGEQAGFDGPDAAQAPAGDGHGLDQIHLDRVGGVELLDVGVEEELELFVGFGGEHDGLGGEAVAEAVAGRLGSAFRGGGAAGLGAVGAGSFGS